MDVKPLKLGPSKGVFAQFQPGDTLDLTVMPLVAMSARAPASDITVPAGYSAVIASDYEIALGNVTELGADGILEVL